VLSKQLTKEFSMAVDRVSASISATAGQLLPVIHPDKNGATAGAKPHSAKHLQTGGNAPPSRDSSKGLASTNPAAPRQSSLANGLNSARAPASGLRTLSSSRQAASSDSPQPEALREAVQNTQLALSQAPDSEKGQRQEAAHAALVANHHHHGSLLDKVMPTLQEAAHGAADGLLHSFGNKHEEGHEGTPAQQTHQHAKRWLAAASTSAVVPDESLALMNKLEAGSGDRLREAVTQRQQDIAHGDNEHGRPLAAVENFVEGAGQKFVAAGAGAAAGVALSTALAGAATGGTVIAGAAATAAVGIGVDLAVNTGAGALHGASRARHEMQDSMDVPKLEDLRAALAKGSTSLDEVPTQQVPLFYVHHRD
jgi:hypothetical protein